jgi:SpoVK/Ycf46/Vps4 family AAA+-type ATPase
MKFQREITKIVEWGIKGDVTRVTAYVKQLVEKLDSEGDHKVAAQMNELLSKSVSLIGPSAITGQGRLPVDSESRLALADEETVTLADVPIILDASNERTVEEFINFVKKADQLQAHGVGITPSLITYGPPGSGKTQLARHIAARLALPIVTARADTLISSFLGSTSKNLRQLFDHVANRRCILFLDELDAFAKLRDDAQELGELKRVVVSLLQNIDALDSSIVLLAATNHEHLLDPAIWRRFAYKLPLALPNVSQRRRLFEHFLNKYSKDLDLDGLSAISDNLSGADIRSISQTAIREVVLADTNQIEERAILWRIIRTRLNTDIPLDDTPPDQVRAIRDLAPQYFSGKRLADLLQTSESTVSRKIRKDGDK